MRIILQFCNERALEERVYETELLSESGFGDKLNFTSEKFGILKNLELSFFISKEGISFYEDTSNVYIFTENISGKTVKHNTSIRLITRDREEIVLNVFIQNGFSIKFYSVTELELITVGSGLSQLISCVNDDFFSNAHFMIEKSVTGAVLRVKGLNGCYLNCRFVKYMSTEKLEYGDVIIAGHVRFIWFCDYISVEELGADGCLDDEGRLCVVHLRQIRNLDELFASKPKAQFEFMPAPRNIMELDISPIELESPPIRNNEPNRSVLLTIGPALSMALPMGLGTILYFISSKQSGSNSTGTYMYTGLVTVIASAILGGFWAMMNLKKSINDTRNNNRKIENAYKNYIKRVQYKIQDKYIYNRNVLLRNNPSVYEIFGHKDFLLLWNKIQPDSDSLEIRLGTGSIPHSLEIKIPKDKFTIEDDNLIKLPAILKKKYEFLKNVPVCTDIFKNRILGVICNDDAQVTMLLWNISMQIATAGDDNFIKMAVLLTTNLIPYNAVEIMKWIPHIRAEDEYYIGCGKERFGEICCSLEQLIGNIENSKIRWIIFTDSYNLLPRSIIANSSVSIIIFAAEYGMLPSVKMPIIQNDKVYRGIIDPGGLARKEINFDYITRNDFVKFAKTLSGISIKKSNASTPIPKKVLIPQLFDDCFPSKDIILNNWNNNSTQNSIRAPIGIAEDRRIINLDLHEKMHGPHGLIAGMTGSGKSEILQTIILSLCIRYSPREVAFFLIDYKGGGMANLFERLPHLAGSISNLSGNIIYRAMVSIKSENERRQRIFLEAGVNSIKDYQRLYYSGRVSESLPHIFIIIDEFAELKREEPDFMKELISVAQVGRSLGVHLILSTQKPSGTVDDNIWSNSRFRIALRVQDKQDSNDMLHRPDAAYISNPGRAFLQIGNDEQFECVQAAYTMEIYEEESKEYEVFWIDKYGRRREVINNACINNDIDKEQQTHFSVIMDELEKTGAIDGMELQRKLWLPPLGNNFCINLKANTVKRYETYIGQIDKPRCQYQGPYIINLIECGHICVCGNSGSGKSTFLQTFLFSYINNENPQTMNIYIIDYSNRLLSCYRNSNLVGCYITEEESNMISNLFCMIAEIINKRKVSFEGIAFEQRVKLMQLDERAIVLIIDNYGAFREKTGARFDQEILEILKFGETYGVYVVITGMSIGSSDIPTRVFEYCKLGVALNMNDRYQYSECMRTPRLNIYPYDGIKGRGIAPINGEILEFQTGICFDGNDYERMSYINKCISRLSEQYGDNKALRVPYIPDNPSITDLEDAYDSGINTARVALGYEKRSGKVMTVDKEILKYFVVAGRAGCGKSNCLKIIQHFLCGAGFNVYSVKKIEELAYDNDMSKAFLFIDDFAEKIDEFYLQANNLKLEHTIAERIKKGAFNGLIVAVRDKDYVRLAGREIFENIVNKKNGIYLGGCLDRQNYFDFSNISYSEQCMEKEVGQGILVNYKSKNKYAELVIPLA